MSTPDETPVQEPVQEPGTLPGSGEPPAYPEEQAQEDRPETVDGKVLDASAGDVPPPAPAIETGQTASLDTDQAGNLTSSAITDAANQLRQGGGTVPGSNAIMVGATPSSSPRPLTSVSEIAEANPLPAEAVIGMTDGALQVFGSAQEAFDAGASVVDRATPHLSPMQASEPAILRSAKSS